MPVFRLIWYTLTELFRKPDHPWKIYKQTSSIFYLSNNVSKTCWEEKGCKIAVQLLFQKYRSSHLRCFKTVVLKACYFEFRVFHLFKGSYFEEHLLLKMYSWNWEKLEIIHKEFYYIKKSRFFNIIIRNKWKCCFYFMIGFLWSLSSHTLFLWCGEN